MKNITLEDQKLLAIIFGTSEEKIKKANKNSGVEFYGIHNTDGTLRWIFPKQSNTPIHLHFYHSSTWKSRLYILATKLLFFLHLPFLLCKSKFYIPIEANFWTQRSIRHSDKFAIFTGTVGPARKWILCKKSSNEHSFTKVALQKYSEQLILNEKRILARLHKQQPQNFSIPNISQFETGTITQTCIEEPLRSTNSLNEAHFQFIHEIYKNNHGKVQAKYYSPLLNADESNLDHSYSNRNEIKILANKLLQLRSGISEYQFISTALAHRDFSPWNTKLVNNKLYVYDWEMAHTSMPLLYDLFHFIIQKEIMIDQLKNPSKTAIIQQLSEHPLIEELILSFGIDIELYLKLYLYLHASYYLSLYENQSQWHVQVKWQFEYWSNLINQFSTLSSLESQKKGFLENFFHTISTKEYAVVKYTGWNIEQFPENSDLDILINPIHEKEFIDIIKSFPTIEKIKISSLQHVTLVYLFFKNGEFLEIDLIKEFKRKGFIYLDAHKILSTAGCVNGLIKVAQSHFDFEYIIFFYQLNNSDIPEKYSEYLGQLPAQKQYHILNYIKHRLHYLEEIDLFRFHPKIQSMIKHECQVLNSKSIYSSLRRTGEYLLYILKRISTYRGMMISISGVDGCGKTTIIEALKKSIEFKLRRNVVVLRHRPGLLPILSTMQHGKKQAELLAMEKGPHAGSNNSIVSSTLRLLYYIMDYLIGYPYIFFKHILKGDIILFDRYYFDFISDPQRSNLKKEFSLARYFSFLIPKPKLNILLYASSETIWKRKQELRPEEIEQLNLRYLKLFNVMADQYGEERYTAIYNHSKEQTLQSILSLYVKAI